jgi:hypothetical protein
MNTKFRLLDLLNNLIYPRFSGIKPKERTVNNNGLSKAM